MPSLTLPCCRPPPSLTLMSQESLAGPSAPSHPLHLILRMAVCRIMSVPGVCPSVLFAVLGMMSTLSSAQAQPPELLSVPGISAPGSFSPLPQPPPCWRLYQSPPHTRSPHADSLRQLHQIPSHFFSSHVTDSPIGAPTPLWGDSCHCLISRLCPSWNVLFCSPLAPRCLQRHQHCLVERLLGSSWFCSRSAEVH